ncbi:MAG: PEP-CTERM sorting domain-containing protein [Pirellulaceae bacterium]
MRKSTWLGSVMLAVVTTMMLLGGEARAQYEWIGTTGDWFDGANWTLGPPIQTDDVVINNGGTVQLSQAGAEVSSLKIGTTAGGTGTFEMTAGELMTNYAEFGVVGTGTAVVSGGNLVVGGGSLFVGGRETAGTGTMTISGGNVSSGDDVQLGRIGTGTLNFEGGRLSGGYTVVGKFGTGTWNQTGGFFDQDFGDLEIGDGGTTNQQSEQGPRQGTIDMSGGIMYLTGAMAIGNRVGGGDVTISGGAVAITGHSPEGSPDNNIFVGRGMNWEGNAGVGGATSLKIVGGDAIVIANNSLQMNPLGVSSHAVFGAGITGTSHTTVKLGGNADLAGGDLQVELMGYTPKSGDSWVLIEAGADLSADKDAVAGLIQAGGFDAVEQFPGATGGTILNQFANEDFSLAPLPEGLSWNVDYESNRVVLSVTGQAISLLGDYNKNGTVDAADYTIWKDNFGSTSSLDADGNGNGTVDAADYTVWKDNFGNTSGGGAGVSAVPEPASCVLLVGGALAWMALRRRNG